MWKLAASDVKSVSLSFPTRPVGGPLHGSLQPPELRRAGEQAVVQARGAVHPTRGTVTGDSGLAVGRYALGVCFQGRAFAVLPPGQMPPQQGCTKLQPSAFLPPGSFVVPQRFPATLCKASHVTMQSLSPAGPA